MLSEKAGVMVRKAGRSARSGRFGWRGFFVLLAAGFFLSCASTDSRPPQPPSLEEILAERPGPRTVAIVPFENASDEPEMAELVRKTFYSHFSPKSYRDVELNHVDRLLEAQGGKTDSLESSLSPSELGALFGADFVIFGKVLNFEKTFLGIYSQIALTVGLEMVDSSSGRGVWQKTLTKRSHEGGLPFSLFGVVPAALRSGLHMNHERTVSLVDRISRDLASSIPEPAELEPPELEPAASKKGYVELQVASFLEPERASETIRRFKDRGVGGRIEQVTVKGKVYHRVLLGPFQLLADAEETRAWIVKETDFHPLIVQREGSPSSDGVKAP